MTITADYVPNIDLGNGVTTTFTVNFPFGAVADLVISLFDTTENEDVTPAPVLNGAGKYDYSVVGTPNGETGIYPNGSIVFNSAPPSGYKVVRERATPARQNTSLIDNGPFPAKTVEGTHDRAQLQLQEQGDKLRRAITVPASDGVEGVVLPSAAARADKVLGFDDDGFPAATDFSLSEVNQASAAAIAAAQLAGRYDLNSTDVLITATIPDGYGFVRVQGYGNIGDGGATLYKLVTSGGDVLSADGKRWAVVGSPVTPAVFGAFGIDGTTDESAAWARFEAYTGPSFRIVLPGRYLVNGVVKRFAQSAPALANTTLRELVSGQYRDRLRRTSRLAVFPGDTFEWFGDSMSNANGASTFLYGFNFRFVQKLSCGIYNHAKSGQGTFVATAQAYAAVLPFGRPRRPAGWQATFNDIYYGGHNNPLTLLKIEGEIRSFLTTMWARTSVCADNTGLVTRSGSFTALDNSVFTKAASSTLAGTGLSSTASGNTLSGSFDGDNFCVRTYNRNVTGDPSGSWTLHVDGTLVADIEGLTSYNGEGRTDAIPDTSLSPYDNKQTHETRIYRGFGPGTHTFVWTDTQAGAHNTYIDTFDTILPPQDCAPIILGLTPRQDAAGYLIDNPIHNPCTEADQASADASIEKVAGQFFGFPVTIARVNDFYDPIANISQVDHTHPTDAGHEQFAQAYLECVNPVHAAESRPLILNISPDQAVANSTDVALGWNVNMNSPAVGGTIYLTDVAGTVSHDPVNNNSRINFQRGGVAEIDFNVLFEANATGVRQVNIWKNGSFSKTVCNQAPVTSQDVSCNGTAHILVAAGDYLEIYIAQTSGTTIHARGASTAAVRLI